MAENYPSGRELEVWYHRLKDVSIMLMRQMELPAIACHHDHKAFIDDMMDRMVEDETYPFAEAPMVVASNQVKKDELMAVDPESMKILALAQAQGSGIGFGRYRGLAIPNGHQGLRPWKGQEK